MYANLKVTANVTPEQVLEMICTVVGGETDVSLVPNIDVANSAIDATIPSPWVEQASGETPLTTSVHARCFTIPSINPITTSYPHLWLGWYDSGNVIFTMYGASRATLGETYNSGTYGGRNDDSYQTYLGLSNTSTVTGLDIHIFVTEAGETVITINSSMFVYGYVELVKSMKVTDTSTDGTFAFNNYTLYAQGYLESGASALSSTNASEFDYEYLSTLRSEQTSKIYYDGEGGLASTTFLLQDLLFIELDSAIPSTYITGLLSRISIWKSKSTNGTVQYTALTGRAGHADVVILGTDSYRAVVLHDLIPSWTSQIPPFSMLLKC